MATPQELISHCEVVKEVDLKAVLNKTYKRKKAFKRLSHAEQDREGRVLIETGSGSAAAFFDLNSLRKTSSKRRHTRVGDARTSGGAAWSVCMHKPAQPSLCQD